MAINPNQLSPELLDKVLVNGEVNLEQLQKIAESRNEKLAAEASKLLQAELSGNGSEIATGDSFESTGRRGVGKYISDWWNDKDKVSTDGNDDGQVSTGEKAESFAKGFTGGIVKQVVKNPVETAVVAGGTAAAAYGATSLLSALGVAAAGPIVAGALVVAGIGFGAYTIYQGLKGTKDVKSDGEVKAGFEEAGTGVSMIALSALGARKIKKGTTKSGQQAESTKPTETAKPAETPKITEAQKTTPAKPVEAASTAETTPVAESSKPAETVQTKAKRTRPMTLSEMQRKATLDKAGFTEDVIAQLQKEKFSYGKGQLENTLKIVEYLENQIANGKKITPDLIREAIKACDEGYAEAGYGRLYQTEQLEVINKYWSHGEEVRAAYREKGWFFTESERVATLAAQRKATLDKAGFTEDVIAQLQKEKFSYGKGQLENTLKMVEYLENQIANGKKITPDLIREAIKASDDIYSQPGYGSLYQDEQLGVLAKHWIHGQELMDCYKISYPSFSGWDTAPNY